MRASSGEVTTTNRDCCGSAKATHLEFENLVALYYRDLYRFAMRMARSDADALDLTQQTFLVWAKKGHQLRDAANVKSWLFTTLRREFLQMVRRQSYFADTDWAQAAERSQPISPEVVDQIDARTMLRFLIQIDESFRAPLVLFFLKGLSYKQIAQLLEIPLGTVQSRIARAKAHLYQLLTHAARKDPDWRINQTVASRSSILSRNDQSNPDRRFQSPVEQKRPSLAGRRNAIPTISILKTAEPPDRLRELTNVRRTSACFAHRF
jgi:RNA polymerase sigma factor (sigma-70 family)